MLSYFGLEDRKGSKNAGTSINSRYSPVVA